MKVLILGASGYLGKVLFYRCSTMGDIDVFGTYYTKSADGMHYVDILDEKHTRAVIETYDPDAIVWCLYGKCNEMEIENKGLRSILSYIKPSVRLIYISTALSQRESQDEETPPEQRSKSMYLADYVNGKILGEELARKHINHVVIRPGQIFGFGANGEADIRMRRLKNEVEKSGEMGRSANSNISVIHVEDLADCIIELLHNEYLGILCVAAAKTVSYYEFYVFLAKSIGVSDGAIVPEYDQQISNYFNTAKATSLLETKIRNLDECLL